MPFVDITVLLENGKFVTNVYRKETFAGVYTNFSSFIPLEHKFGLVYMLLHRCFFSVSDISKFHFKIEKVKEIILKNYFSFKDDVPAPVRSCQIYNFTCGSCNASYIGKTFKHMKVMVSEHQGVSPGTGKHLKGTLSTSVRDHMLDCNHVVVWDDFKVLEKESNHWLLEIK